MLQGSWFAVLPDHDAASQAADRLRPWSGQEVRHASGRPWLLGRWEAAETVTARAGVHAVAVIGRHTVTEARLAARLGRAVTADGVTGDPAAGLPGGFHLVMSSPGRIRVRGTASATRRVFTARHGGAVIAADRADVLAALTDASVEVAQVAMRLLSPQVAHPFGEHTLWAGVAHLPADHELTVEHEDRVRRTRWWTPPEPLLPMAEGAERVRTALHRSLSTCRGDATVLSCDLSGGMDSTSLCFLAAAQPAALVTVQREAADPANDDPLWARLAARHLPDGHHVTLRHTDVPAWYADAAGPAADAEEPYKDIRGRAYRPHMARRVAALGARTHLSGLGGDELFGANPLYLHDLLRSRPLLALSRLAAHRATARWPLAAALRALAHRGTFDAWLKGTPNGLTAAPGGVSLDWMPRLRLPGWATPHALDLVRGVLREAARTDWEPLSPLRVQQQTVQFVRSAGMSVRQVDRLMRPAGAGLAAPFLDDEVITAAMSVRLEDRFSPTHFKPLLARAMHGQVPEPLLNRTTKGDFSYDLHQDLRRTHTDLVALTDSLLLGDLGLVDPSALRRTLLAPHPRGMSLTPLESTFSCESWLRGLRAGPAPDHGAARWTTAGTGTGSATVSPTPTHPEGTP
ncbi:asparagine synthase-related protein [Streptomyces sp. NPDC056716]|uniref:asparagine synthase-related protein n=1 Tax=unclassified Streptomyces TaxID=2593676 RepID=UPI0036B3CE1E